MIARARRKREKKGLGEGSTRNTTISTGDYDDLTTDGEILDDFNPDEESPPIKPSKQTKPQKQTIPVMDDMFEDEDPDEHAVNLIGDNAVTSDASTAIKALLGQGGDIRASSQLEQDQIVAILDLLYVSEQMNSPALAKTAEDFLLLRISSNGGTGRQQIVSAFKGLYEPQQGQMQNDMPSGSLRGRP